ncbi:MAG: hypothetical protein AAGD43_29270 [Pseudomonadota bacterium]
MKIKVFTLATDDDNGTKARVFGTEVQRDDALLIWVGSNRETWQASKLADDLHEYIQSRTEHLDTFSTDEDEIDLGDVLSVNAAWAFCKEQVGAFGNLYDPDEAMTIMDGWAEEGDTSDGSHWFNVDNAEDREAVTAWCEQEGPDFEQQISNLVCENMPTRKAAYDALREKRSAPQVPIFT